MTSILKSTLFSVGVVFTMMRCGGANEPPVPKAHDPTSLQAVGQESAPLLVMPKAVDAAPRLTIPTEPTTEAPSGAFSLAAADASDPISRVRLRWRIALSANYHVVNTSSPSLNHPVTLAATANKDVGPTPYFITIWEVTSSPRLLALCGGGTTCSTQVSVPDSGTACRTFVAHISATDGTNVAGSSRREDVLWSPQMWTSLGMAMRVFPCNTVVIGEYAMLTAINYSFDIGPTPFWFQVFDLTAGVQIGKHGSGTDYSIWVSHTSATTHEFQAYLTCGNATLPFAADVWGNAALPEFVTWSPPSGFLKFALGTEYLNGALTVTAMIEADVGSTPYYLEIFDATAGTLVATCRSGRSCSTPAICRHRYVAFVSSFDATFPPAWPQASSNTIEARCLE
jgi:hypothetical protein